MGGTPHRDRCRLRLRCSGRSTSPSRAGRIVGELNSEYGLAKRTRNAIDVARGKEDEGRMFDRNLTSNADKTDGRVKRETYVLPVSSSKFPRCTIPGRTRDGSPSSCATGPSTKR